MWITLVALGLAAAAADPPSNHRAVVEQIDAAVARLTPSAATRLIAGEELAISIWRESPSRLRIDGANGPVSYRCYYSGGSLVFYREQSPGTLFTFAVDPNGKPAQVLKEVNGKKVKVKSPELEAARARGAELLAAAAP
jgi:hypothetical protein